ncbi:MAG: carbon-nitrogen hydrolase family protein [Phototrophicaceae bacterium]
MPRTIQVAAVRMNADPAPKSERLPRAAALIAQAAQMGAQLVVLPELFNTGYEYHENNYTQVEPIDGETVTWMKAQAHQHGVHLCGSLMLLDGKDVVNSQILVAPDGRRWRYDKNYPFALEHAYFRDGSEAMIAHTDLGKFGMMICWDYAHPELWQRYAGKVDAMLITSSPPRMLKFTLVMPDGHRVDSRALGPLTEQSFSGDEPFGKDLDAQVGWLGVPAVHTTVSGDFKSGMPRPRLALLGYTLFRPDLWRHLPHADEVEIQSDYYSQTKIINAAGDVLSRVETDEGVTVSGITLADDTPKAPSAEQPEIPYNWATYFLVDVISPAVLADAYRAGVRQQFGQKMAPRQGSIRWEVIIGLGLIGVFAAVLRLIGNATSRQNK